MNEKDLRYFCAVYEYRNISHAATHIFITPQGLSKAIKRLEEELEIPLFVRNRTGIEPTPYADKLYQDSQDIIRSIQDIKNTIIQYGNKKKQVLTAAFTLGVIDYLGLEYILEFQRQYPDIKLNIIQNSDLRVDEIIQSGQAEFGILAGPIDTTVYNGILFTVHRHCLVINKAHPLALKDTIDYTDLTNVPIALEGREFRPYHNNMHRFLENGVTPHVVLETTEIESTHKFASQNNGIGISVDFCAFSHPYENTVIRPFRDPSCLWETFLVTKQGQELSPNAKQFFDYSIKWKKEHNSNLFHWDPTFPNS